MAVHLTRIYTRTGDDGTSALGDFSRVSKTDPRLVAYADWVLLAVLLVQAAVPSALLNVEINLAVLEDQLFVRQTRAQAEDLMIGLDEEVAGVLALVRERIAG